MTDEKLKPLIQRVKIGTLEERLRASANTPLDSALRALAKQEGQPTTPDPIAQAIAYERALKEQSESETE